MGIQREWQSWRGNRDGIIYEMEEEDLPEGQEYTRVDEVGREKEYHEFIATIAHEWKRWQSDYRELVENGREIDPTFPLTREQMEMEYGPSEIEAIIPVIFRWVNARHFALGE